MTAMNELIPISQHTDGDPTVDGRDLHKFLEVGRQYSHWIQERIEVYGFEEVNDFWSILAKSTGGRPKKEYHLSLDMAKELAMVERTVRAFRKRREYTGIPVARSIESKY